MFDAHCISYDILTYDIQQTSLFQTAIHVKIRHSKLRYTTEDYNVDLRDRTKANVKREESLLLVTSYSTLFLTHIANIINMQRTFHLELRHATNFPIRNCDIRQSRATWTATPLFLTAMCIKRRYSLLRCATRSLSKTWETGQKPMSKGRKVYCLSHLLLPYSDAHRTDCDMQQTSLFSMRCAIEEHNLNAKDRTRV